MADKADQTDSTSPEQPSAGTGDALRARIARLLNWAAGSRLRKSIIGATALVVLGGTFAFWSYLAHLAVDTEKPVTLEMALAALDKKEFEEAKSLIGRLQQSAKPEMFGGALFVLGSVKSSEAETEWSAERQRASHLIAARYLQKARTLGVPEDRESQSLFLLGYSLVRGNQPAEGIVLLKEALQDDSLPSTMIHTLLTEAFLATPDPDFNSALLHNQTVLAAPTLEESDRLKAMLIQSEILLDLHRIDESLQLLNGISLKGLSLEGKQQALVKLALGRAAVASAQRMSVDDSARTELLNQALSDLREAQRLDPLGGQETRRAMIWIGRGLELQNQPEAAIRQYDRISKQYGDTPEGLVATLAKAQMHQAEGNTDAALVSYRRLLESVGDPVLYANRLLPLSNLRKRLLAAQRSFAEARQFEEAVTLVNQFPQVFDLFEVTKLRAHTHQLWGQAKQDESLDARRQDVLPLEKESRYHFRTAGRAFEILAELRFATRHYPDDLWAAAESYYQGQSYTHAVRVIQQYLQHEAQRRKARALLRLGQSLLAAGQPSRAIRTLEECIELYPRDGDIYQARLECARAYLEKIHQLRTDVLGDTQTKDWETQEQQLQTQAERLLLTNYTGDTLTPQSVQWRDSLFVLGMFLYDSHRYLDAIRKLEEAVLRYPEAKQTLLASYTIARSFHNASQTPGKKLRESKTENERQKNRKLRDKYLQKALDGYLAVQRDITIHGDGDYNQLESTLLRDCYMMQGSVLYRLKRFEEARKAFGNVSTVYQNEPFVLESFVHIANCWRRLNQQGKARGTIERAKLVLERMPEDVDFRISTNFSRQQWKLLLNQMSKW